MTYYSSGWATAAAGLVNTVGSITGNEYLDSIEAAERLLAEHVADHLPLGAEDLEGLRDVRSRLREVFLASEEDTAAEALNAYLQDLEVQPYLTDHDGRWHLHYVPAGAPLARQLGAAMAMGLATLIAEHGFSRLGVCNAPDCKDVFVDTSRNRSRRYCSDVCSTRTNVAAHRARRRATAPGD